MNSLLSIVVPVFNEQSTVEIFYEEILKVKEKITGRGVDLEILYVDDGSRDNTLEVIKSLASKDDDIRYVSFSRNFGKESAIYAGLNYAKGDYVVIMDVDLQDPPALLPERLNAVMNEGFDCVGTKREDRKGEPPIRSFFARRFYKLINQMSHTEIVDGARDYQLMNRKVVSAILSIGEYNRFSKGIFGWVGFKKKWIAYENIERVAGETKWSFWKLFVYALEGITAYSTVPLVISFFIGMILCLCAFIFIIYTVIRVILFGDPTRGWPSLVCIITFLSGIQMLFFGIIGQYLAKAYMETKHRPIFLIGETNVQNI